MKDEFANRLDADHVIQQLPPVGGPEHAARNLIEAVEAWTPSDKGGLVMLGPTGSGKTTAACHLVRTLLGRYEWATSTAFMIASDLADSEELVEKAKRVRMLIIDDLGKEHDRKKRIFRVLDHRHTRYPTVITCGIKPSDLDQHYDGATIRRMFEFRGQKVARVSSFAQTVEKTEPLPVGHTRNPVSFHESAER